MTRVSFKPALADAEDDNGCKDEEPPAVCIQFRWKCSASETDEYLSGILHKLMDQPEISSICLMKEANENWDDTSKACSRKEKSGTG